MAPAVADYRPTDPQIAWHLAHFIEEVRSIPADPVVLRQNWLDAYNYVTNKGALALDDYARRSDPFAEIGKTQVAVDVSSVIRASDDSFRVAWIERHYADDALDRDRALERHPDDRHQDADRRRSAEEEPPRRLRPRPQLVEGARLMRHAASHRRAARLGLALRLLAPGSRLRSAMTTRRARRVLEPNPPKPVQVVELPKPLPLPGQLKRLPRGAACAAGAGRPAPPRRGGQ